MDEAQRAVVGAAWAFRFTVEREASGRFARLADRLASIGVPQGIIAIARQAAEDEAAHALLCAELAEAYGAGVDRGAAVEVPEVAPGGLSLRERVVYEAVAACCIAETESTATLTTLLASQPVPRVREVLHTLARDEVNHARLGWALLASEQPRGLAFLERYIPDMIAGTAGGELFGDVPPEREAEALAAHGVLPHARKRQVFVQALREVIFPGLEQFGVDAAPARAWLAERAG